MSSDSTLLVRAGVCAGLLLLLIPTVSLGQGAVALTPACDCAVEFPVETARAELHALRIAEGATDPDVLFDTTLSGGQSVGGAELGAAGGYLPPNWRTAPSLRDAIATFVTAPGVVIVDSATFLEADGTLGASNSQVVGALAGRLAPQVRGVAGARLVQWSPIVMRTGSQICETAGAWGGELVIGHDIYRLPRWKFPRPTLRDFLVHGYLAHADRAKVDFTVADATGQASDLDPADGLSLVNPDGLPDTGDEILTFVDAGPGAVGCYWYRVQPVLRGRAAYFDGGTVAGQPSRLVDLDGDGLRESVDVLLDGRIEFADPSGRGLGLTHGGEILSSPLAGLGNAAVANVDCHGKVRGSIEVDCVDGGDDDGDGAEDCDDGDCASHLACQSWPDEDADGVFDACDICPAAADSEQLDGDLDGMGDACDACPQTSDPDQDDADSDGMGDACDACPQTSDPDQDDADSDGMGDACDACPQTSDPDQDDADSDGVGDACDACPEMSDPEQADTDADAVGDACDACPETSDPDQADADADGVGDACEPVEPIVVEPVEEPQVEPVDPLPTPGVAWGDVAPAGAPDGRINVGDVIRLLHLALGLEPLSPAEALAGDVAPAEVTSAVPLVLEPRGAGNAPDVGDVILVLRAAVGEVSFGS